MAFMGIFLVSILLVVLFVLSVISLIFFIISMVLFFKSARSKDVQKKSSKTAAIVTLIISVVLFLPVLGALVWAEISFEKDEEEKIAYIDSIENKAVVNGDEWLNGFEYKGKNLVPVDILRNSKNFYTGGQVKNLNEDGAVVENGTTSYHNIYEVDNDSGYKIYYVWHETLPNRESYTRTFVDKNEYDAVLDYYNNKASYTLGAYWESAPQDIKDKDKDGIYNLDLNTICDKKEFMQLVHEALDGNNSTASDQDPIEGYDNYMKLTVKSKDKVCEIDLVISTKGDEMNLYLNELKIEDEIVQKYKDFLLDLINDSQKEILQHANDE